MSEPTKKTVFTQRMVLHLNGGSDFSQLNYEIMANGVSTGISRVVRTDGRPRYMKTIDQLQKGDEVFDVLATKGVGMMDWIETQTLPETTVT
jgi:hypothetical protein